MVLLYYLGTILLSTGVLLLLPAASAPLLGEPRALPVFLAPALLCIFSGCFLRGLSSAGVPERLTAFKVAALGWLLAAFAGSLPYLLFLHSGVVDAYFEAMSGFTTTGISVLNPGQMPRSLVFWRSLTEWAGGVGIVVLMLAFFQPVGAAVRLYPAEARSERLEPSMLRTTWKILYIYVTLTLAAILVLYLSGDGVFRAVNHALTAVSTGGFSITSGGFADSPYATRLAIIPFMLAGGMSFALHSRVMGGEFRRFITDQEVLGILLVVLLLSGALHLLGVSLLDAVFTAVSAITTTGFTTLDISGMSDTAKYLLLLVMLVGGCTGSTAGGIKMFRALVVLKSAEWHLRRFVAPRGELLPLRLRGRKTEEEVLASLTFVLLYLGTAAAGVLVFMLQGHSMMEAAFTVLSAQGNNGLTVLSDYTAPEEVLMILHMWMGRLELIPVLALLMRE